MLIVEIQIGSWHGSAQDREALIALTTEQRAELITVYPPIKEMNWDREPKDFYHSGKWRISIEELAVIESMIPSCYITVQGTDGTMITKLKGKFDKLQSHAENFQSGGAVQISVPDLGLMLIDEVDWLEDACTQELQSRLDEGWRILAVCPPNAQRRPDYILGRPKARDGR